MKFGHEIHYDSREELIEDLILTYRRKVKKVNSTKDVADVIEPMLINLSPGDRENLGREFSSRMRQWDKKHLPRGEFDNPYVGVAFYLDPLTKQD